VRDSLDRRVRGVEAEGAGPPAENGAVGTLKWGHDDVFEARDHVPSPG
jgi:hypothetical protein